MDGLPLETQIFKNFATTHCSFTTKTNAFSCLQPLHQQFQRFFERNLDPYPYHFYQSGRNDGIAFPIQILKGRFALYL